MAFYWGDGLKTHVHDDGLYFKAAMVSYEARNASTPRAAGRTEWGRRFSNMSISELDALVLLLTLGNAAFPRYAWKPILRVMQDFASNRLCCFDMGKQTIHASNNAGQVQPFGFNWRLLLLLVLVLLLLL